MINIAIANQKGGVGKTTTAVTLAHGAAIAGLSTLIIDLDTQGNVADSLGLDSAGSLTQWLGYDEPLEQVILKARSNLMVVRADKTVAQLKMMLSAIDFREMVIKNHLSTTPNRFGKGKKPIEFDLVIMDCAPSVDVLHTAALVAADLLVIPTKLDQFAIKGVTDLIDTLKSVQLMGRSSCQLAGIVPTFYDKVTRESHDQFLNLAEAFGKKVWPPIPQDSHCRTANRHGVTLWEMKPTKAQEAYGQVLDRLMKFVV